MKISMTNFVNLTPHDINMYMEDGSIVTLPSEGIARASEEKKHIYSVAGVPVYSVSYGNVSGVPEEQDSTYYVVSKIVADALKDTRSDILIVTDTVRDEQGRIIGCRGLATV